MKYNKLGQTDVEVSEICLGTMTWGEQNTEADAWEQLDYSLDHGVNFIDTAELYSVPARAETYGSTEIYIGNWIAARKNREKYILASKIAGPGAYTAHIRNISTYSKKSFLDAVEGSLRRLQTDYIDLYQIHWPERRANFFGQRGYSHSEGWEDNMKMRLEVLKECIESGKIRYIGISNETPWGTMNYLKLSEQYDLPRIVSVQNPYNLLNRSYETGMSEISIREQAGLLAYSPLAFGRLTDKYIDGTDLPEDRLNKYDKYDRYDNDNCLLATKQYHEIAQSVGLSLAQLSLAWIRQRKFVTSTILGATKIAQLKENILSAEVTLDYNTIKKINAIHMLVPDPGMDK